MPKKVLQSPTPTPSHSGLLEWVTLWSWGNSTLLPALARALFPYTLNSSPLEAYALETIAKDSWACLRLNLRHPSLLERERERGRCGSTALSAVPSQVFEGTGLGFLSGLTLLQVA